MKNIVYILVCASVIFFTACSSQDKNKKDGTQVLMQDSTEIAGPQRMQVSDVKTSFTYKGKEYQSSVVRRPDESLPIVKNEQGGEIWWITVSPCASRAAGSRWWIKCSPKIILLRWWMPSS